MQEKTGVIAGKKADGNPIFFSIHAARHTHTAFLIEAKTIPTKAIQKRLGHGSHDVTMNIYAHVTKSLEIDSADAYEEATADIFENIN
jgi:integrase